jgi:DNA-binding NtrC family response regulator
MQRLFGMIPMVADSPATVLIEGPTGTGKDLLARIIHSSSPPMISEKAMQVLLNYAYPGNVREMENILEHALILCRNAPIEDHHLPDYLYLSFRRTPRKNSSTGFDGSGRQEREAIAAALEKHKGHRGKAARDLGMDRTTLWRKMKRLGGDNPSKK